MANITHGKTYTQVYRAWLAMIARCTNPNHRSYKDYGGRGISVCSRWRAFEEFFEDMGDPPTGYTLDRISTDGDYTPDNCRWATQKEQMRNKRNSRNITINGETLCMVDWAERLAIPRGTIKCRIDVLGWNALDALTRPVRGRERTDGQKELLLSIEGDL